MFDWRKKESPILSLFGLGGGAGSKLTSGGASPYSVEIKLWGGGGSSSSRPSPVSNRGGGGGLCKSDFYCCTWHSFIFICRQICSPFFSC